MRIKFNLAKNKKANIPIILFVIGIFLVCSFALLTFFISDFKLTNSFVGVDLMRLLHKDIDEYKFYVNQGVNSNTIGKTLGVLIDSSGKKYFYYEKNHTVITPKIGSSWSKEELLFSVTYYVP